MAGGVGTDTSVVYVGVLQYGLEDGGLEAGGGILDECLNCGNFGTGGIITGGAVTKWDCSVTKISPGWVGSRWTGEEGRWDADDSEVGALVTGAHRSEEFFDIVDSVVRMTPGPH